MRDTLPRKAKLNECGILNLHPSSGDGTHWVMWFKKGKDKFYFNSYGVQPPSDLIAYLRSPLKQLSLGNNLQAVINYLI